jgi:hypothetical protein
MSRSSAKAAQNQLATTNAAAAGQGAQAGALENKLIPSYEGMMNEGYTPEQMNAMETKGMGSEAAGFDTAGWMAGNRAARTGNAASTGAEEAQLARDKGVGMGAEAAGIQTQNADVQQANKRFALQGEQGLFGENLGAQNTLYGMGPSTINAQTQASAAMNPWMQLAGQALGAAGTAYAGK